MGFSFAELAVILVVALIVIGPDKLPSMAKSIGKGYGEFRRAFNEFKKNVDISADEPKSRGEAGFSPKQTYKSRWEEQSAEVAKREESVPAAETPSAAPEAESAEPARAKRGDLIKEEDNGGNG